ncbi:MAG TPA: histidine--tRNA ligase [Isosphaeraceae bacterium]|jgi:histidyl-tRNA synthetase|nr:histidine--tRNA ligase [Isosphaeraceae bacterium]
MIDPRVAAGLRDLGPMLAIPREALLATFRRTFAGFGFVPIETPHIERMEVLTGKGAGSDEVLRQIFEVTNTGGTRGELALRFDLTVPLARFIAKHVDELRVPFKRYAIGSVFRGERPAKGRFREFVQCDFDTVGTVGPLADAETAQVIHDALGAAGIPKYTIALNHRGLLDGLLDSLGLADRGGAVLRALDKLAKAGRDKVRAELTHPCEGPRHPGASPTTILPSDQLWSQLADLADFADLTDEPQEPRGAGLDDDQARRVLDFAESGRGGAEVLARAEAELGSQPRAVEGIARLRAVLDLMTAGGVPESAWRINLGLARGLDYYTGVVFETTVDGWERFGSICSGGRYDDLAGLFTNRRLPGVGASIGLDRLLALLDEAKQLGTSHTTAPVLVAQFPGVEPTAMVPLATRLRKVGIGAEVYPEPVRLGEQLGYGSARGHRLAVIVGPDEHARGAFNLRDLATRSETKGLPLADLESAVAKSLGIPIGVTA